MPSAAFLSALLVITKCYHKTSCLKTMKSFTGINQCKLEHDINKNVHKS